MSTLIETGVQTLDPPQPSSLTKKTLINKGSSQILIPKKPKKVSKRPDFSLDWTLTRNDSYNALADKNLAGHFARPNLRKHLLRMRLINKLDRILYNPRLDPVRRSHRRNFSDLSRPRIMVKRSYQCVYEMGLKEKKEESVTTKRKGLLPNIHIPKSKNCKRVVLASCKTRNARINLKTDCAKSTDYSSHTPSLHLRNQTMNYKVEDDVSKRSLSPREKRPKKVEPVSASQLQTIMAKYKKLCVIPTPLKLNHTVLY